MLAAGIVAVSPPGTPRPPVIPVIEEAMEDASASTEAVATEAEAEAVAEAAAVLGPEVIAALLVVIAIIIILWFILKDANCYVVMLNQSKAPVVFLNEYKISGQPGSVAQNIPAVETITRPASPRAAMCRPGCLNSIAKWVFTVRNTALPSKTRADISPLGLNAR